MRESRPTASAPLPAAMPAHPVRGHGICCGAGRLLCVCLLDRAPPGARLTNAYCLPLSLSALALLQPRERTWAIPSPTPSDKQARVRHDSVAARQRQQRRQLVRHHCQAGQQRDRQEAEGRADSSEMPFSGRNALRIRAGQWRLAAERTHADAVRASGSQAWHCPLRVCAHW